jgi:hypothetical protein
MMTACERVFLPDEEDVEEYSKKVRDFSRSKVNGLSGVQCLAFSCLRADYLNILEMLRLAGIPARKEERTEDPLVMLDGICSFFNLNRS